MTRIILTRSLVYTVFAAGAVVVASAQAEAYDCLDYCTSSCTAATVTVPESRRLPALLPERHGARGRDTDLTPSACPHEKD